MDTNAFNALLNALKNAETLEALDDVRQQFLGKKGLWGQAMRALGGLDADAKKAEGACLNQLKQDFMTLYKDRQGMLEAAAIEAKLRAEAVDTSLPAGRSGRPQGTRHILSATMKHIVSLLERQGFSLRAGPDIEDETLNFDALNIPPSHPARADHDTLYLKGAPFLLRTHTSPVQIRTLYQERPPLRIISAGRVFRDDYDATHTPMFHQIEGLVIEPNIHMGHLKGCLQQFLESFFGASLRMRFRPNYFPFTEPSYEVDIFWDSLGGKWLEVLGCGMVHPNVLRAVGLDPARHQGFAFGLGAERLTMLRHKLSDLRPFFMGDRRWIQQTGQPWL